MSFNKVVFFLFLISCSVLPKIFSQPINDTTGDSINRGTYWGAKDILESEVSIEVKNVTLKGALEFLEKKYRVNFVYDSKLLSKGNISLTFENKPLGEVLAGLFQNTDLSYVSLDNKIIIAQKKSINQRTGAIKGRITADSGEPLISANVLIMENNYGTATDENGEYIIKNLQPGEYTLSTTYIGFEGQTQKVTIYSGRTTELNLILKSTSFNIGGIEVVGAGEFIPLDPETKTEITSGEIEHLLASSLNDILELMPGVTTSNPTLSLKQQAVIRGGETIGTQVIVDGVPLSNAANLQSSSFTTMNQGVDLRSLPAENIESVEIIRGVPSVKYGDLVDGAIIVKTKTVPSPLRLKAKYNPNITEANISGGLSSGKNWVLNGSFNFAASDSNLRVDGDGYTRIASQLKAIYDTENLTLGNSFYYTRAFDERKEAASDEMRQASYNRDHTLKYIGDLRYVFNSFTELNATFSVNYTSRNSYRQKVISRDNAVLSDRTEEGAQEGTIVFGSYLGKEWVKGEEWNLYADIDYETGFFTGSYLHKLLFGLNWTDDFNKGDGIIFDPLYPLIGTYTSPRMRRYDEIPAFNTAAFYIQDKIVGRLWKPFTLQVGIRYEVYRPTGVSFKGLFGGGDFVKSHNGAFLNPRINFSYNLFEDTQIRLGYGVTSKAPPLGMIFAQDEYYDIVDTVSVVDPSEPDSNFSIISTYIKHIANEDLKGYKQYKYEASVDQKIGPVGFTITGYLNETKNMFTNLQIQTLLYSKSFPEWPNTEVYALTDTIFDSYNMYVNKGSYTSKGIEFTFKTKKIPVINTIFSFDGDYSYSTAHPGQEIEYGAERYVEELGGRVKPFYYNKRNDTQGLLLNYRFDIQAKSLGMWITLHVQEQLFKLRRRLNGTDTLAIGYYSASGETVYIDENERKDEKYTKLINSVEPYEIRDEKYPDLWLVNLKVSKSLWKGAAISFFVNNVFKYNPLYRNKRSLDSSPTYVQRNPKIFYGMEFQTSL